MGDVQNHVTTGEGHYLGKHVLNQEVRRDGRQNHGAPVAQVQSHHDAVRVLLDANEEGADDGVYDA